MNHSFNVDIACELGVNSAILLDNIFYWCEKNRANSQHFHDGNYWVYNSAKAFAELFPYMTERAVRYSIEKLIEAGYIESGCFNENPYDRTAWYAVTDKTRVIYGKRIERNCKVDVTKLSDVEVTKLSDVQMSKLSDDYNDTIINANINANINYTDEFEEMWKLYPRKVDKATGYKKYKARLKEGYSHEDMLHAVVAYGEECRKERREGRFIKHMSTFFGPSKPFEEYIKVETKEQRYVERDGNPFDEYVSKNSGRYV